MAVFDVEVVFVAWLKRRRLKPGNCLNHAKVLLGIPSDLSTVVVLCMGPVHSNMLHCWLEAGEVGAVLANWITFF